MIYLESSCGLNSDAEGINVQVPGQTKSWVIKERSWVLKEDEKGVVWHGTDIAKAQLANREDFVAEIAGK